ncbi:diguanylate cyclase (GGDEF)-like protein [Neorhizobium huautlense]|uniref:diguanylate cyclase n=1 Tax=Neorhizobium huautlense TaxID=67774 RepID=A0ABT9PXY0_9HYPH|nr:diguanylate cyclase [Neorhizobium huautlense]MDP9838729.1 diguanylate cyclase (GGDEF)-like protein [Neorhizobium huautlense]
MELLDLASRIVGLMALLAAIFGAIERSGMPAMVRKTAIGFAFGAAACICMMFPVVFSDGTSVNGRSVFLAFSAAFGGPISFVAATGMTSIVHEFAGAVPFTKIMESTLAAAAIGLAWRHFIYKRMGKSYVSLLMLGFSISLVSLLLLKVSSGHGLSIFLKTYPAALAVSLLSAIILGRLIEREMRHIRTEQRWKENASTDALSLLSNKRAFESDYTRALERNEPFSLIILDIDHFKRVNDTYGHVTGDEVIMAAAKAMTSACRFRSMPYRLGGEEFGIIAYDVGIADAVSLAENVRGSIAALHLHPTANLPAVTISAGVVSSFATADGRDLLSAADAALYLAKNQGRNRVISWNDVTKTESAFTEAEIISFPKAHAKMSDPK